MQAIFLWLFLTKLRIWDWLYLQVWIILAEQTKPMSFLESLEKKYSSSTLDFSLET